MTVLTKSQLEQEVHRLGGLQPWWHDIELPFGVRTVGRSDDGLAQNHNALKWPRIRTLVQFDERSILDLGCNEGFYCFEALTRGADRVVGIDINEHRIEKARFVASVLEIDRAVFLQESAYDVQLHDTGGRCDVVLALGLLHRVPDPYSLIMKAAELGDAVILEWAASKSERSVMEFWGGNIKAYDNHNTGYWRASRRCVKEILLRAGFSSYFDIEPLGSRAILAAATAKGMQHLNVPWNALDELPPLGDKPVLRFVKSVAGRCRRLCLGR